ncbi:MAG TPA: AAA family ATPase, partial [Terriglobia bacterium]|nr:AAA family ATPase [Terriglobia bacterium]
MFLTYYGLHRQPFGVTPDPASLFPAASHREAFASLMYGIEARRGFMALIAPPGMGKTTLLFRLMDQIRTSARSAFLFQMQSSPREFLYNLAVDMGLECSGSYTLGDLQRRLNDALLEESRQGRRVVLALDEAQHLDHSILETVRMLSNFETTQAKLMQVILAGQPQLADRLAS